AADEIHWRSSVLRHDKRQGYGQRDVVCNAVVNLADNGVRVRTAIVVLSPLRVVMTSDVVVLVCERDGALTLARYPGLSVQYRTVAAVNGNGNQHRTRRSDLRAAGHGLASFGLFRRYCGSIPGFHQPVDLGKRVILGHRLRLDEKRVLPHRR